MALKVNSQSVHFRWNLTYKKSDLYATLKQHIYYVKSDILVVDPKS